MVDSVQLDLGAADVHRAAAVPQARDLSISAAKRKSLPESNFALPEKRKYPLDTAKRTRNAAARLEQMKKRGKVTDAEYKEARGRIAAAAKKFGIESQYNESDKAPPPAGSGKGTVHVRADLAPGGALHVRHHMSERPFWDAEGQPFTCSDDDVGKPVWIQVAKSGSFAGHPAGPFELNTKVFGEIIANFKATKNRAIPIDYEHASEQDPTSGSIPQAGAPAQGWIRDLRIDGDNLWGLVEWLPQAREQIRAGAYKYISPAIRFNSKDRMTGERVGARMTSAALTNSPFLDAMQPLAAKDSAPLEQFTAALRLGPQTKLDSMVHASTGVMGKLKEALRLHPLSSAQDVSDHLEKLRDACMTTGPDGMFQGCNLDDFLGPLRDLSSPGLNSSWEDVLDALDEFVDAEIEKHVFEGQPLPDNPPPSASMADHHHTGGDTEETLTMADHEALTIALRDAAAAKEQVTTLTSKVTSLEGELSTAKTAIETLTVSLKDANAKAEAQTASATDAASKLEAASKAIEAKDAELVTLRDAAAKRAEADLVADVEMAFETHKDAKKLTDADKPHMLAVAKASPGAFHALYPPVDASKRHLLQHVTPPEPRDSPTAPAAEPTSYTGMVRHLMSEKGMSYEAACAEASRKLTPPKK